MPEEHSAKRTGATGGEGPLAATAREALDANRARAVARLAKVVAKPPAKAAVRLAFAVSWNGYHGLSVYCAPQAETGEYTSHSPPYGTLLSFDPPPGQQDNPHGFATEKPAVAALVLRELSEWWRAAGGARYPLPAVGTMDGEPVRIFDFATKGWVTDETAVRRQQLTSEFAARVRGRLERLRPAVVERLRKAAAKLGPDNWAFNVDVGFDDEFEVMFGITDGAKHAHGRLFPPHSQLARLLGNDALDEDRERYAGLGVDTQHTYHRELEQFVADVWAAVAGPGRVTRGRLQYDGDLAEYDLVARRWVTDFLGRPLAG